MAQNAYSAPQRPSYHQSSPPPAAQTLQYSSASSAPSKQLARQPSSTQPSNQNSSQVSKKTHSKSRSFSFRSDRSSQRKPHSHHIDLHETSQEKEAKRIHSKADPTMAMNEAEPSAVASGVKSSLAPLRAIQHKDLSGNPIADPDKSNPTRSRWERPLDTIRSFEAAIDGAYSARRSYVRAGTSPSSRPTNEHYSYSDSAAMRPRSYYPPRFPQESYYSQSRPGSQVDPARQRERDGHAEYQQGYGGQYASGAYNSGSRQRPGRMQSESGPSSYLNGARPESVVYPLPNNQLSYETVVSGASGSSGVEASGYATDPTSGSENSSINRNGSPGKRTEPTNDYGINFGQSHQAPVNSLSMSGSQGPVAPHHQQQPINKYAVQPPQHPYAPAAPRKEAPATRNPMQISAPPVSQQSPVPPREKRKSWFVKRFSRSG